jgi:murein DD-endopeptidase MepM/ murein hydrolase activator NlpD
MILGRIPWMGNYVEKPESTGWRDRAVDIWERLFPDREFYYRSQGRVYYRSLGGVTQSLFVATVLGFFGWVSFASINLIFKNEIIDGKNLTIAEMRQSYDKLSNRLDETQQHFDAIAGKLEAKHKLLLAIVTQNADLEQKLSTLTHELKKVSSARDKALTKKRSLSQRLAILEADMKTTTVTKNSLGNALDGAMAKVSDLKRQRDTTIQSRDSLASLVDRLELRLADIKASQQSLITRLHERTALNVSEMEDMIKLTGLDLEKLVASVKPKNNGQGGPFVKLGPNEDGSTTAKFDGMKVGFGDSVLALEAHLGRWEALQDVAQRIPLAAPADSYYLSSGYGRRKDPIRKKWANHYGLDLAGRFKTRIRATAAGIVTFAGRNGLLGRMVEISHGMGLKTRYGHLHRILVKKGQRVEFRDKIGLMGSTGRSTGYHVHYEVIYRGKPKDPAKFLKAGRYVFKNG